MSNELLYTKIRSQMDFDQKIFGNFDPNKDIPTNLGTHYREFLKSHCCSPVIVWQPNHYTGVLEKHYYPCGHCDHCLNIRSNDLSIRFQLDAREQGNVYFLTLTYGSIRKTYKSHRKNAKIHYTGYVNLGTPSQPFGKVFEYKKSVLQLLSDRILHFDNFNHKHSYQYSPCLFDLDDFSGFMKRLRKSMPGTVFQYTCCGEFGHNFGRPHLHAILTSDKPVSLETFRAAWSIYGCPIGSIYVDDLANNSKHGVNASINKSVKYVCKYMSKGRFSKYARERLEFAYLYKYCHARENERHVFRCEFNLNKYLVFHNSMRDQRIKQLTKLFGLHENEIDYNPYQEGPQPYFEEFCESCWRPPRYSTRHAIGSLYLRANLERFIQGNFELPPDLECKKTFPRLFVRKVQNYRYPISVYKTGITGSSYTTCPTSESVLRTLEHTSEGFYSLTRDCSSFVSTASDVGDFARCVLKEPHFFDSFNRQHLVLVGSEFLGFKFDRSEKDYIQTGYSISYSDFYETYYAQETFRFLDTQSRDREKYFSDKIYDSVFSKDFETGEYSFYTTEAYDLARESEYAAWEEVKTFGRRRIENDKFNYL